MKIQRAALSLVASFSMFAVTVSAVAQQTPPPPTPTPDARSQATRVADEVVAKVAGWKIGAAKEQLDNAKAAVGGTPEYRAAQAYVLAADKKYDDALQLLNQATKSATTDPAIEYLRGDVLAAKGKYTDGKPGWDAARARAEAILKNEPKNGRANFWLGASLVKLQRYDDALKALNAAAGAGMPSAMVDYQRGLALVLKKDYQGAVEALDRVQNADERFAHLYFYRALAWNQLGKKDKMLADMDQFLKLAPTAPEADQARAFLKAYGG